MPDPTLTADPGAFTLAGPYIGMWVDYGLLGLTGAVRINEPPPSFGTMFNQGVGTRLFLRNPDGGYSFPSGGSTVTVYLDNMEGTAATHHITQGWSITRMAVVDGLNSGADSTTGKLFEDACNALIAVVGDRGSPCPDIPVPTYLEEFIPEIIAPDACKIRIVYKGYPLPTFEFDAALNMVESNLDAAGNPIVLEYTYPADYKLDIAEPGGKSQKAGKTYPQGGTVNRPANEPSFTIHFRVVAAGLPTQIINGVTYNWFGLRSATECMTYLAMYEGTVNDGYYQIGLINGAPRTWMCTKVRGISKDGGTSYEASMTFQYRAMTWDQLAAFTNPDDGKVPPDVVAGTGTKQPHMAYAANFPTFSFGPN